MIKWQLSVRREEFKTKKLVLMSLKDYSTTCLFNSNLKSMHYFLQNACFAQVTATFISCFSNGKSSTFMICKILSKIDLLLELLLFLRNAVLTLFPEKKSEFLPKYSICSNEFNLFGFYTENARSRERPRLLSFYELNQNRAFWAILFLFYKFSLHFFHATKTFY